MDDFPSFSRIASRFSEGDLQDGALHVGKRTEEAKTLVTPQMHDLLVQKAREARCTPSDLFHDVLFLVLTGSTYADHVANDRRVALGLEGRQDGEKGATT